MSEKNGGPAFPREDYQDSAGTFGQAGMSLRDYFAAQALARYTPEYCGDNDISYEDIAVCCYRIADAMLKWRAK